MFKTISLSVLGILFFSGIFGMLYFLPSSRQNSCYTKGENHSFRKVFTYKDGVNDLEVFYEKSDTQKLEINVKDNELTGNTILANGEVNSKLKGCYKKQDKGSDDFYYEFDEIKNDKIIALWYFSEENNANKNNQIDKKSNIGVREDKASQIRRNFRLYED